VLFIDASRDFTTSKTQNVMEEAHVARVLDIYAQRAEIARYSHCATPAEIAENDFNLNIPRYVDTFEAEEAIDIATLQRDINRIEQELAEVRTKMAAYLRELGVDA
jgi:type I restriction enzyme M protein